MHETFKREDYGPYARTLKTEDDLLVVTWGYKDECSATFRVHNPNLLRTCLNSQDEETLDGLVDLAVEEGDLEHEVKNLFGVELTLIARHV